MYKFLSPAEGGPSLATLVNYYRYGTVYPFLVSLIFAFNAEAINWLLLEHRPGNLFFVFVLECFILLFVAVGFLSIFLLSYQVFWQRKLFRWICWWAALLVGCILMVYAFSHEAIDRIILSGVLLSPYPVGFFIGWLKLGQEESNNNSNMVNPLTSAILAKYYRYCLLYPFVVSLLVVVLYWLGSRITGKDPLNAGFLTWCLVFVLGYISMVFLPLLLLSIADVRRSFLLSWVSWWALPFMGSIPFCIKALTWTAKGDKGPTPLMVAVFVVPYVIGAYWGWRKYRKDFSVGYTKLKYIN